MNSKKAITLLVLTTLLMSMIPVMSVSADTLDDASISFDNDDHATWGNKGEKGQTIMIESNSDIVSSGYEVMVYWDKVQTWDGNFGLLNISEVDNDGGFEIWFDVPEAKAGEHDLWFTATDQSATHRETFDIVTDLDLSSSSGLAGAKPLVDLWGFAKSKDIALFFVEKTAIAVEANVDFALWNAFNPAAVIVENLATDVTAVTVKAYVNKYNNPMDGMTVVIGADTATWTKATNTWAVVGGGTYITSVTYVEATRTVSVTLTIRDYTLGAQDVTIDYECEVGQAKVEVGIDTYDVTEEDYDGTLLKAPIEPLSMVWTVGGGGPFADSGTGNIMDGVTDIGNINYVTGEWTLDVALAAYAGGAISVTYDYFDDIENHVYVLTSALAVNSLGSLEDRRITISSDAMVGNYYIVGMDSKNNRALDDYKIGATITLSETEGPVGSVVEVEGQGFEPGDTITVTTDPLGDAIATHIIDSENAGSNVDVVDLDGEFVFEIIIPQTDDDDEKFPIKFTDAHSNEASVKYKVTALAKTSVDPGFGPQGSTVTVSGVNFPQVKDTKVVLWLTISGEPDVEIDTVKTDADGTFEDTVTVPTENDDTYKINAVVKTDDDGVFSISDNVEFRVGTIMVLMSKDEAVAGDKIVLTGNGFTLGDEWNATFGDVEIFSEEITSSTGLLKVGGVTPEFHVPQVAAGEYEITIWDVDAEIMITVDFTVTGETYLELDPAIVPNEYNMTISGYNWPEVDTLNTEDEISFVLWNATDDWDMDVMQMKHDGSKDDKVAVLNGTGFFNDAFWIIPEDDDLSMGSYTVNATIETTEGQEYLVQLDFVLGEVHSSIAPRKATFRIGDTVSFNIEHSFGGQTSGDIKGGDIRVYDPSGALFWDGDPLNSWAKTDMYYTAMYAGQTAATNPMVLLDDAPLGTWTYKWRDATSDKDTIAEGSFTVAASSENVINEAVADLPADIDDLVSDIAAVSDLVSDVTGEFDDVRSDIANVADLAKAAADAATKAAEAVSSVATVAGDAADAALAAKDAATGLTTLVYGAIGASLVAALAAIVSLMQISRRIAG